MDVSKIAQSFPIGTLTAAVPVTTGLIHSTFQLTTSEGMFILQRINAIFGDDFFEDVDAVTTYLREKGVPTFTLIKTTDGERFKQVGADRWRVITMLPGAPLTDAPSMEQVEEAGACIGTFHNALADYPHALKHRLTGFHDTKGYMEKLARLNEEQVGSEKHAKLEGITEEVLRAYAALPAHADLPLRVLHGDPQLSNVLFNNGHAYALIDLDTIGTYLLIIEIGDMLRTFCDAGGKFNPAAWDALLTGYLRTAEFITPAERAAIPDGLAQICLELTARFIIDAYEERYFALNTTRYETLAEQNTALAHYWYDFYRNYERQRQSLTIPALSRAI